MISQQANHPAQGRFSDPDPLAQDRLLGRVDYGDRFAGHIYRFGIGFDEDILLRLAIITPRMITASTPATTRTIVTVSILFRYLPFYLIY